MISMKRPRRFTRIVSVCLALFCVVAYTKIFKTQKTAEKVEIITNGPDIALEPLTTFHSRHLLDSGGDNCTKPRNHHEGYNDSCSFVLAVCGDKASLINYLAFTLCDLEYVQPLAYILMAFWVLLLISLLATTADYFFVPPLEFLSEKLRLPEDISGITLLAIGNGAPDVFTAFSALQKESDMALLLSALIGASLFISTVVFGSVILLSEVSRKTINVYSFMRDVSVYIVVVIVVVAVAFDGTVYFYEAISFLVIYVLYIAIVVANVYISPWIKRKWKEMKKRRRSTSNSEETSLLNSLASEKLNKGNVNTAKEDNDSENPNEKLELVGLTWPKKSHIGVKIQFVIEWPISLLRWITCPPCYHDKKWDVYRKLFASIFPVPSLMLVIITFGGGWDGFNVTVGQSQFPVYAFFIIIGLAASFLLFYFLPIKKAPHPVFQFFLGLSAFIFSICWLNIEANEVVATLEAFGLLFSIDTAILGLTVLAVGNSVGDWVADTAVARAGKPAMGVSSCFGSPLLNDVLGLGIALSAYLATNKLTYFTFHINSPEYNKVKLSWIFLGISLLASAAVMPIFKFTPPKAYGIVLIYLYIVFMVFSILDEVGILPIHLGDGT